MFCGDDGAVVKNYVAKQEGMCDFLNTQTISCCSVLARLDGVVELKVQVYFRHIMNASVGEFEPADARGRVGRVSLLPAFTFKCRRPIRRQTFQKATYMGPSCPLGIMPTARVVSWEGIITGLAKVPWPFCMRTGWRLKYSKPFSRARISSLSRPVA